MLNSFISKGLSQTLWLLPKINPNVSLSFEGGRPLFYPNIKNGEMIYYQNDPYKNFKNISLITAYI